MDKLKIWSTDQRILQFTIDIQTNNKLNFIGLTTSVAHEKFDLKSTNFH